MLQPLSCSLDFSAPAPWLGNSADGGGGLTQVWHQGWAGVLHGPGAGTAPLEGCVYPHVVALHKHNCEGEADSSGGHCRRPGEVTVTCWVGHRHLDRLSLCLKERLRELAEVT